MGVMLKMANANGFEDYEDNNVERLPSNSDDDDNDDEEDDD